MRRRLQSSQGSAGKSGLLAGVERSRLMRFRRRYTQRCPAREGYRVVEEAVDDGHSGADPHRPGLRRVMELAEGGAIDVVLAKKRNRLFRSRLYRLLWDQDLGEFGVKLVALDDTGNRFGDAMHRTSSPSGSARRSPSALRTGFWRSVAAGSWSRGSAQPMATVPAPTATPWRWRSRRWRWCV